MADLVTRKMWNDAVADVEAAARTLGEASTRAERTSNEVRRATEAADAAARQVGIAITDHKAALSRFATLAKRTGEQGGTVEDKADRAGLSESILQGATGRGN